MTNFDKVKEFHRALEIPIGAYPELIYPTRRELRLKLIREEFNELTIAAQNNDLIEVADALADLLYVTYGAAAEWGIDINAVFDEVHRSNMTKLPPDGKIERRRDGKVMKPPTFQPPNIREILHRQCPWC